MKLRIIEKFLIHFWKLIEKYNKDIMENLHDLNGKFKTTQNLILGAEFEPTKPYLVPFEIEDWCNNLSYRLDNAKTNEEKVDTLKIYW